LTKQKKFSQNFQIAKSKKGWGVQGEEPHLDLFTIQKKSTFLILQADSYFSLKKNLPFPQEGCHFLQGNEGGVPLRVKSLGLAEF